VPASYSRRTYGRITPWPIGPNRGSCGTAAFTKQRVIIRIFQRPAMAR